MARNGTYHGDAVLTVGRPAHVGEDDALADVRFVQSAGNTEGREITDAVAVTIASWWAGPRRGDGLAMAELSTSGTVRLEDLADDLSAAFGQASGEHLRALECLATWALGHPSRRDPAHKVWEDETDSRGRDAWQGVCVCGWRGPLRHFDSYADESPDPADAAHDAATADGAEHMAGAQ